MVSPYRLCISNSDNMRRFLKKILIAVVMFSSLIMGAYFLLHHIFQKPVSYNNNCVFVWGDSQMYQGLDVSLLGNKMGRQVLTSAEHGLGVYDFLVSQKSIPNNAVSIVSFPEGALYRNPLADNNRTGFEIECLKELFFSGCPVNECFRIFNLNRRSVRYKAFFNSSHGLFPYADSLEYPEPLPLWHSIFEEPKEWFSWKAKAYTKGIQHLSDKQAQIILIQFPFDNQVEAFARKSINRHLSDSLKVELVERFEMEYDTLVLHNDSLLMHDLSHMNEVGARLLTTEIAEILRADTASNHFIEVQIR